MFRVTTLEAKHTVLQTCLERKGPLFLHAILGCDTTSRVYGIGMAGSLKQICQLVTLQRASKGFQFPLDKCSLRIFLRRQQQPGIIAYECTCK